MKLWDGKAPGETGNIPAEKTEKGDDGISRTSNVSVPTMTPYFPAAEKRNGTAVLVCPGGGYNILASEHEGSEVCKWLNDLGVTAVLLKYRVPRREGFPKHEAPLEDAQRALEMIREKAAEWHVDPKKVGILGFSAGGHLAAVAMGDPKTDDEVPGARGNTRPDFGILIYPAYLVADKNPDALAPELKFDKNSQPTFLAVSSDDGWASSSARLYLELQRLGTPVEMHAFAQGGHGYGITKMRGQPAGAWPELCADWLRIMKLIPAAK